MFYLPIMISFTFFRSKPLIVLKFLNCFMSYLKAIGEDKALPLMKRKIKAQTLFWVFRHQWLKWTRNIFQPIRANRRNTNYHQLRASQSSSQFSLDFLFTFPSSKSISFSSGILFPGLGLGFLNSDFCAGSSHPPQSSQSSL